MAQQTSTEDVHNRGRNNAQNEKGSNTLALSEISANVYDNLEWRDNNEHAYGSVVTPASSRANSKKNPNFTANLSNSRLNVELSFKALCAAVIGMLLLCTLICTIAVVIIYHTIKANIGDNGQRMSSSLQTGPTINTTDSLALQIKTLQTEFNELNSVSNNHSKSLAGISRQLQTLDDAFQKHQTPVHGSWSSWTRWNACSVSCGVGLEEQTRTCSNPYPASSGNHCFGENRKVRMCSLPDCHVVMFKARNVFNTSPDLTSSTVIRYDTAVVNIGGGYNTSTGFFTAPYSGLYSFTIQTCTHPLKTLGLHVMAAGKTISALAHVDLKTIVCSSGDGVANMKAGDQVWVKWLTVTGGTVVFQDGCRWNSFSGMLIHKTI